MYIISVSQNLDSTKCKFLDREEQIRTDIAREVAAQEHLEQPLQKHKQKKIYER